MVRARQAIKLSARPCVSGERIAPIVVEESPNEPRPNAKDGGRTRVTPPRDALRDRDFAKNVAILRWIEFFSDEALDGKRWEFDAAFAQCAAGDVGNGERFGRLCACIER